MLSHRNALDVRHHAAQLAGVLEHRFCLDALPLKRETHAHLPRLVARDEPLPVHVEVRARPLSVRGNLLVLFSDLLLFLLIKLLQLLLRCLLGRLLDRLFLQPQLVALGGVTGFAAYFFRLHALAEVGV